MSSYLAASAVPLVQAHDAVLLDLDGVVYRGALAVEHAADSIAAAAAAGAQPVYVTNNAGRPPQVVADQLEGLGIPTDPAHVMTSSLAAAKMLAQDLPAGSTVLCVGGPGLAQAMSAQGYRVVTSAEEHPDAVAQGYGPHVGWAELTEAAYAVGQGSRYIATNLDASLPTERGMAVGNGSLVAAVVNATGVRPVSAGKPEAGIFHEAAALVGSTTPVVVGDRLDTDLAGARAAGMPGLHVLTGVSQAYDLIAAAAHERPDLLAIDLRGLLETHPEVTRDDDGAWHANDGVARVSGTDLHVVRDGIAQSLASLTEISLDELRAACCAAWEAADGGAALTLQPRPLAVVAA